MKGDIHKVQHVFRCWARISQRLQSSSCIALFLDFDGTLAPLQPRPEDVWLDGATRHTLSRIAHSPRFRVWIVSGRRRADVRARVRVKGIRYLGLHGWEGRTSGAISDKALDAVTRAKNWLAYITSSIPGVWIEDKGPTVAIHYRSVADEGLRQ